MLLCLLLICLFLLFFFKQKTAYEMRISDWSSDVCSSDLLAVRPRDGDGRLEAHQLGKHLGAADDGDALGERRLDLRVAALDRSRGDDDGDALDILRRVADRALDAALPEAFAVVTDSAIAPLYLIDKICPNFGTTHTHLN